MGLLVDVAVDGTHMNKAAALFKCFVAATLFNETKYPLLRKVEPIQVLNLV
jgi:hypothetical protein